MAVLDALAGERVRRQGGKAVRRCAARQDHGHHDQTRKPDKYERCLAEVFFTADTDEIFLNNALLENRPAVRKDVADFGMGSRI
jgi:hypothetical protein